MNAHEDTGLSGERRLQVPTGPASSSDAYIDLDELAERVYRLLREEIRLAQARGVRPHS